MNRGVDGNRTLMAVTARSSESRVKEIDGRYRGWRDFAHDIRAVAAIEFALIAVPFVALLFAIIETALVFFGGQTLETAVANAARQIRTGQAQQNGVSAEEFKQMICQDVGVLFDCGSKMHVDVRTFADFDSVDVTQPFDEDGDLKDDFEYDPGGSGEIVIVRVFYEWPILGSLFGLSLANMPNGNHLLASTSAFRNEPFPW